MGRGKCGEHNLHLVKGGRHKRGRLEVGRGKCGEHNLHLVKGGRQEPI